MAFNALVLADNKVGYPLPTVVVLRGVLEITAALPAGTSTGRGLPSAPPLCNEVMLDTTVVLPIVNEVVDTTLVVLAPQVAADSLPTAMVDGICGNLRPLLDTDDHMPMLIGRTLVLGVRKLRRPPASTLDTAALSSLSPLCAIRQVADGHVLIAPPNLRFPFGAHHVQ